MIDRRVENADIDPTAGSSSGVVRRRQGETLGLRAFEKISAVEGIRLSQEMRQDLQSLDARKMDESQRSRFIRDKYGKG